MCRDLNCLSPTYAIQASWYLGFCHLTRSRRKSSTMKIQPRSQKTPRFVHSRYPISYSWDIDSDSIHFLLEYPNVMQILRERGFLTAIAYWEIVRHRCQNRQLKQFGTRNEFSIHYGRPTSNSRENIYPSACLEEILVNLMVATRVNAISIGRNLVMNLLMGARNAELH